MPRGRRGPGPAIRSDEAPGGSSPAALLEIRPLGTRRSSRGCSMILLSRMVEASAELDVAPSTRPSGQPSRTHARHARDVTVSQPVAGIPISRAQSAMDMIRALQSLLDPLIARTCFILTEARPLDARISRRFGFLEYHGTLDDGRTVLLGVYQFSTWRTVTAEMWAPDDARRMPPEASVESVAMHRQVWSYDLLTDG